MLRSCLVLCAHRTSVDLAGSIRCCYRLNKNLTPSSVQSRFAEGMTRMTYCGLLGTSWSEEKVKECICQGLQVLGGRRKGFLFSILSSTCQRIRENNFPPGRSHRTFSLPSISSAWIATCSASPNVAHSCLWCVKMFMMLKTREMWLMMLCWRLGVVQGKDHFILFLLLPSLKTNIDTEHWG